MGACNHTCGTLVHLGEARVAVQLSGDELEELALATSSDDTAARMLCALSLLDARRAEMARSERSVAYIDEEPTR